MMQSGNFPPSWQSDSFLSSTIDQYYGGLNLGFFQFDQSSEISPFPHFSAMFSTEISPCNDQFQDPLEGLEAMFIDGIEDIYNCFDESEESFGSMLPLSSQTQDLGSPSASTTSVQSSLTMPGEAAEVDNRLSVFHLLKAYGEAIERNQSELAEVILRCIGEKASPVGETWERVAFSLCQGIQQYQSDYLMQESSKNFDAAFRVFYQMFPYWRFAHFAANSAILEAMPDNIGTLHVVDFDIGEGIQWPPVIEAMAWKQKSMTLTSICWGEEDTGRSPWRFEDRMRQLRDYARSFGVKLKGEEMGIHDLVNELNIKKRDGNREWLAFNCTVGMGKSRGRKMVNEFLNVAQDYVSRGKGIITFGEGDACEKPKNCSGFNTFFDSQLMHYQAVLESMESDFAKHLLQARLAMECLFVGPNICGQAWLQKWREMKETLRSDAGTAIKGLRVSSERLMEAKEIVKERDSLYEVSIGGDSGNELALEWRGITLVRVSTWRNQS
ncbi:hypothetical protein GQ457_12G008510 [Hibiscus cannabinus]